MEREELLKYSKILYECHLTSDKLKHELENAFPELKERGDDRIRKSIESIIRVYEKTQGEWFDGYDMDTLVVHLREAFGALEKQKEQTGKKWIYEDDYKSQLDAQYQQGLEDGRNEQKPEEWGDNERIREALIKGLNFLTTSERVFTFGDIPIEDIVAYLEKQKAAKKIQYELDAPLGQDINGRPIYFEDFQDSTESGDDDRINSAELSEDERIRKALLRCCDDWDKGQFGCMEKEDVPAIRAYLERQKDSDKAMSAIEKIDKYIDSHTANAHDMEDSNPDKKYYSGVDDTLSDISGILISAYSEEKQKEKKDYRKLYEDIAQSEWFKKAYIGKSLGGEFEQKEQNVVPSRETILGIWELGNFWKENPEGRNGLTQLQYIQKHWLEKCDYQKEQKPTENISQLIVQGKGVYKICPRCKERMVRDDSKVYTSMPPQYGYKCPKCGEMTFDTVMYDSPEMEERRKPLEWSEDYREEDLRTRFAFYTYKDEDDVLYLSNVFVEEASRNKGFGTKILAAAEKVAETIGAISIRLKVKQCSPANAWYRKNGYGYIAFEYGYDWLEKTLGRLKPVKQEWSEEDESVITTAIRACRYMVDNFENSTKQYEDAIERLKSLLSKKNISYGELPLVSVEYIEGLDTDFEKQVGAVIASAMNREHQFTSKYIKWTAQRLMECAKDKHISEDECVSDSSDNSDNKEWSEDDKTRLKVIKEELERYIMSSQYGTPLSVDDLDWLNSLPERFNLECKPSEKQMKALNEVVNILAESKNPHESDYLFNVLNGLRNSLKKL